MSLLVGKIFRNAAETRKDGFTNISLIVDPFDADDIVKQCYLISGFKEADEGREVYENLHYEIEHSFAVNITEIAKVLAENYPKVPLKLLEYYVSYSKLNGHMFLKKSPTWLWIEERDYNNF